MPTLTSVAIPMISRSEPAGMSPTKSRSPLRIKPRMYDDSLLPIQASCNAPRNARIVNRVLDAGVATFEIKIGDTSISDIGLDEILEYVSAYELEEYENRAFEEERELMKIVEAERERQKQESYERAKQRARLKGVAELQEKSGAEDSVLDSEGDVQMGRHGRARPSYKKLFKKMKVRRRRKRDPTTGELMPLSDDEDEQAAALQLESSEDEPTGPSTSRGQSTQGRRAAAVDLVELPRRRRRKRDPDTGELLPLNPVPSSEGVEKQKRPRRRRHPITNELMPLGWRYDPDAEGEGRAGTSTEGSAPPRGSIAVQSFSRLSLDQEQQPKRRRLDPSSEAEQRAPAVKSGGERPNVDTALAAFKTGGGVINLVDSTEGSEDDEIDTMVQETTTKPKLLRRSVGGGSVTRPAITSADASKSSSQSAGLIAPESQAAGASHVRASSESSSSSEIPMQTHQQRSRESSAGPVTSIFHSSANTAAAEASSSEGEDDYQLDDDEYAIEGILAHHPSDPRTHPPELGNKPVMLYQVSWVGWDEPTWEPLSSFGDLGVVREYQRRAGMAVEPEDEL